MEVRLYNNILENNKNEYAFSYKNIRIIFNSVRLSLGLSIILLTGSLIGTLLI